MNWGLLILTVVSSYLIGAFPTAYLIAKGRGVNIFQIGSGNMGATNVARALGPRYAALTALVDVGKGVVAVLLADLLVPGDKVAAGVAAALAAVIGHSWSIFILFLTGELKGGKSAAVSAGTWLMLTPLPVSVVCALLCGLLIWRVRIVSFSVLAAFTVGAVWIMVLVIQGALAPILAVYGAALVILLAYRHRTNIDRLRRGVERRIDEGV